MLTLSMTFFFGSYIMRTGIVYFFFFDSLEILKVRAMSKCDFFKNLPHFSLVFIDTEVNLQ